MRDALRLSAPSPGGEGVQLRFGEMSRFDERCYFIMRVSGLDGLSAWLGLGLDR